MFTSAGAAGIMDPAALFTIGVAALMVILGLHNRGLELRRPTGWCGSCGRRLDGRRCRRCAT
ncbi:MAG: hypothetical protein ACXVRJ_12200 [Gaiellaceae bacterium]